MTNANLELSTNIFNLSDVVVSDVTRVYLIDLMFYTMEHTYAPTAGQMDAEVIDVLMNCTSPNFETTRAAARIARYMQGCIDRVDHAMIMAA